MQAVLMISQYGIKVMDAEGILEATGIKCEVQPLLFQW